MTQLDPSKLPNRLADLLEVACDDMAGLDREHYSPNGSVWHTGDDGGLPCELCLGGAVLAGTIGIARTIANVTDTIVNNSPLSTKLMVIDELRCGNVGFAADLLYGGSRNPPAERARELLGDRDFKPVQRVLAERANFYSWQHWDALEPVYRDLVQLLRAHDL
ncbi:MAG: hypothetical protein OXC11_16580 [Rhodospirillales bacterium]|nr:hypothetical protein [Rhodospirillales bacterium]